MSQTDLVRLLIVSVLYLLIINVTFIDVNKCHLFIWLAWNIYWFNWMSNLSFGRMNIVWICVNVSYNQLSTFNDYLLYNSTIIIVIICLIITYSTREQMGKSYNMHDFDIKTNTDHILVTKGWFKFVRHPIYSFGIIAQFATLMATKFHWLSLIFFLIGTIRFLFCIPKEEKVLINLYGDKYKQYQQQTKYKLLPFIW
eukprot:58570_1